MIILAPCHIAACKVYAGTSLSRTSQLGDSSIHGGSYWATDQEALAGSLPVCPQDGLKHMAEKMSTLESRWNEASANCSSTAGIGISLWQDGSGSARKGGFSQRTCMFSASWVSLDLFPMQCAPLYHCFMLAAVAAIWSPTAFTSSCSPAAGTALDAWT